MSFVLVIAIAGAIFSFGLALAALFREPKSVARASFSAGMILLALESAAFGLSVPAGSPEAIRRWQELKLVLGALVPAVWLLFSFSYARGNYREFLARRWWILVASFLVPLGVALFCRPGLIHLPHASADLYERTYVLGSPGVALNVMCLTVMVHVLMNLERTFRASVGTMRWRIKFLVLGLAILFAARLYSSSQILLYSGYAISLEVVNGCALLLACALVAWSFLRSGMFNVDVYPSREFLSHSVTLMLAGVYLFIVGILAQLVSRFGGSAAFPFKALLVLASLTVLAMFFMSDRARQSVGQFVSRHLRRPAHDYRQVWRTLIERTASVIDEAELCRVGAKLVSETLQVLSVTVWLVEEKQARIRFGGSTVLVEGGSDADELGGAVAAEAIRALRENPNPINLDEATATWVQELQRRHPGYFPKVGGKRFCLPLMAAGEVLGLMTLGDRVRGQTFSVEDMDLLKSVAEQVGGSLLNLQLSKKLLQAKELEAFQKMSAFFVHDLKNTAATLSLMVQNLPVQFENPEFRKDALQALSKSVKRIDELISRLSLLRQAQVIHAVETDLNALVTQSLAELPGAPHVTVRRELQPLPRVLVDPEQIQKVVTNLFLNAAEAIPSEGQIRIQTSLENGWAQLAISDTGCGMRPEFIRRDLFQPFRTTKKKGIGIGMFHTKAIVDAHRGRIDVESEVGKGTTFRVFLPVAGGVS